MIDGTMERAMSVNKMSCSSRKHDVVPDVGVWWRTTLRRASCCFPSVEGTAIPYARTVVTEVAGMCTN